MNSNLNTWKAIDIVGQIAMAVLPLLYYAMSHDSGLGLFIILFTVGGWQTLSFLIHLAVMRAPWIARGRRFYSVLYIIVACGGLLALAADNFIFAFLYGMLVAGPVMAVIYFIVSIAEWKKLRRLRAE